MFCIAIEQELRGSRCPLPATKCLWQHRKTNACCYSKTEDMDLHTYCKRVGADEPDEQKVQLFLTKLRASV